MRERRYKSFSIRGPVILFTVVLMLSITLTVLWNVVLVHDYNKLRDLAAQGGAFHWTMITLGSVLFLGIIVLLCILVIQLIHNIRWSQRQANFIASVSHELNSPLSSIKLFTQTLKKDALAAGDRAKFLDKILLDVDRLSHIISNILRAAEVDHRYGELLVSPERVDLYEYLEEYVEHTGPPRRDKLRLTLSGERGAHARMDRMMFRQVLDNLIDNAIRYRGDRPAQVDFQMHPTRQDIELRVVDQGIGIPRQELRNLFQRFYRVQGHGEQNREGLGIGLNVVRAIVLSHEGTVTAGSDGPGKGASISIRLPRWTAPDREKVLS